MTRSIRDRATGAVLASGVEPDVFDFEGNVYFTPATVSIDCLVVTDETYTCPYKGTCNWVSIRDGASKVAWVYADPKPGHDRIRGAYGFYRGQRQATEEVTDLD